MWVQIAGIEEDEGFQVSFIRTEIAQDMPGFRQFKVFGFDQTGREVSVSFGLGEMRSVADRFAKLTNREG